MEEQTEVTQIVADIIRRKLEQWSGDYPTTTFEPVSED